MDGPPDRTMPAADVSVRRSSGWDNATSASMTSVTGKLRRSARYRATVRAAGRGKATLLWHLSIGGEERLDHPCLVERPDEAPVVGQWAHDEVPALIQVNVVGLALSCRDDADAEPAGALQCCWVDLDSSSDPVVTVCAAEEQIGLPQATDALRESESTPFLRNAVAAVLRWRFNFTGRPREPDNSADSDVRSSLAVSISCWTQPSQCRRGSTRQPRRELCTGLARRRPAHSHAVRRA